MFSINLNEAFRSYDFQEVELLPNLRIKSIEHLVRELQFKTHIFKSQLCCCRERNTRKTPGDDDDDEEEEKSQIMNVNLYDYGYFSAYLISH